VVSRQN